MEKNYSDVLVGYEDKRKIYFEYGEYLKILKYSKASASDGARGVLLGYKKDRVVYVVKVLEALYSSDEGIEGPAFSPDSWGRINAEIKNFSVSYDFLGHFSTHTSVAPDRMDYVTQEKYFSDESNILFVFDPANNEEKVYLYENREFVFLNGFYLFDKFQIPIDLKLRENIVRPLTREYEIRMRIFNDIKSKIKKQNNIYIIIFALIFLLIIYLRVNLYGLEKNLEYKSFSDKEITGWNSE